MGDPAASGVHQVVELARFGSQFLPPALPLSHGGKRDVPPSFLALFEQMVPVTIGFEISIHEPTVKFL